MTREEKHDLRLGLAFVSPWAGGFILFSVYPLVSTIIYSLCDYSVLSRPVFIGTANYTDLATDALFWKSVYNTVFFAAFAIPLGLLVSLTLAVLLNFDLPGKGVFRTVFFLPSLIPLVCVGVLWQWMLNGELGLLNGVLRPFYQAANALLDTHAAPPNWLSEARYARWGIIFSSLWASARPW